MTNQYELVTSTLLMQRFRTLFPSRYWRYLHVFEDRFNFLAKRNYFDCDLSCNSVKCSRRRKCPITNYVFQVDSSEKLEFPVLKIDGPCYEETQELNSEYAFKNSLSNFVSVYLNPTVNGYFFINSIS